jgi:RNA polymerase sigma-70 factor (ECF subfamily)
VTSPYTSADDLALFQGLKAKQSSALEGLYDRYGNWTYSLAYRILGDRQEAEDLIQEVFLNLWQNCTYNPSRGSFKSYLTILVRSRAIDQLRKQKTLAKAVKRQQMETDELVENMIEMACLDEIAQRVQTALAAMPEKQRQALEMAYYQGLTQLEISQYLQVPLGTVKSWFRLSFAKMRHILQDLSR